MRTYHNALITIADLELFCLPNIPIEPANVVSIEDPPIALFSTNTPQCQDNRIVFSNNTEVGCDGQTLNTQLDSLLIFQWDFGDCNTDVTSGTFIYVAIDSEGNPRQLPK